jgi:hypothetical protein
MGLNIKQHDFVLIAEEGDVGGHNVIVGLRTGHTGNVVYKGLAVGRVDLEFRHNESCLIDK